MRDLANSLFCLLYICVKKTKICSLITKNIGVFVERDLKGLKEPGYGKQLERE